MSDDDRSGLGDALRHNLAKRVRLLRAAKDWSQEDLAHESGKDRATIARVEGTGRFPTVSTLLKIANALDIPLADLFCDEAGQPIP